MEVYWLCTKASYNFSCLYLDHYLGQKKLITWFSGPRAFHFWPPHCWFYCGFNKKKICNALPKFHKKTSAYIYLDSRARVKTSKDRHLFHFHCGSRCLSLGEFRHKHNFGPTRTGNIPCKRNKLARLLIRLVSRLFYYVYVSPRHGIKIRSPV